VAEFIKKKMADKAVAKEAAKPETDDESGK
jgi:hypothetical protein